MNLKTWTSPVLNTIEILDNTRNGGPNFTLEDWVNYDS